MAQPGVVDYFPTPAPARRPEPYGANQCVVHFKKKFRECFGHDHGDPTVVTARERLLATKLIVKYGPEDARRIVDAMFDIDQGFINATPVSMSMMHPSWSWATDRWLTLARQREQAGPRADELKSRWHDGADDDRDLLPRVSL